MTKENDGVVLVSLRIPAPVRASLRKLAAQETLRRGERVSVNTLIHEACVEKVAKSKGR